MANSAAIAFLVFAFFSLGVASDTLPTNQTLGIATQEMQKSNYFAFVMLLNMVPSDKFPTNITFLMPNNRVLAKAVIPESDVLDFLLRHSIPSPLRFDHLSHIPTGSIIPSSEPNFALRVSNNGRRSYYFNNVKLISPDICLAVASVRCHGIDGVLVSLDKTPPLPPNETPPMTTALPPRSDTFDMAPAATPQPAASGPTPDNSGSLHQGVVAARLTAFLFWVLMSVLHI